MAVASGDTRTIECTLADTITNASYFSFRGESSYTLVVFTLLHALMRDYNVRWERETDNGRSDVIIEPKCSRLLLTIFDPKRSERKKNIKAYVKKTMS